MGRHKKKPRGRPKKAVAEVAPKKDKRKKLSAKEIAQPLDEAVDETYREMVLQIRERVRNGEKATGEEIKLLEKMKAQAGQASAGTARVIAQDQINTVLQSARPKALAVALEILDDKKAPAAVRLEAAKFTREWSDDEEPPEEPVELVPIHPAKNVTKITPIENAKCAAN